MTQAKSYFVALACAGLILSGVPVAEASLFAFPTKAGGPTRVGEEITAAFASAHPYAAVEARDAVLVSSEMIHFPGASYVSPHFSRFELSEGDYVVVRTPDERRTWKFERYGKLELGKGPDAEGFWGVHMPGDTAIIELWSSSGKPAFGYSIDRFARGFTLEELQFGFTKSSADLFSDITKVAGEPQRALCGADDMDWAQCYRADGSTPDAAIYDNSRPVARLLIAAVALCTGWLVGCDGQLITNQHCIQAGADGLNTDYEFMAEGACGETCAQLDCPGVVETSMGLVQASSPTIDYTMVQLINTQSADVAAEYGYMQLRPAGGVIGERIYIPQHPGGQGKRIAVFSSDPSEPTTDGFAYLVSKNQAACQSGGPNNEVGYYADTEGGSSGSPVLAYSDHKVVALHHCASCQNLASRIEEVIADLGTLGVDLPSCSVCADVDVPQNPATSVTVPNEIDVSWDAIASGTATYDVLRRQGTCAGGGGFSPVATGLAGTAYNDTGLSGGVTYAYAIRAEDASCQSLQSDCVEATASGSCLQAPEFAGVALAVNAGTETCRLDVAWAAGSSPCGGSLVYNVYRGTSSGFTPDGTSLLASCVSDTTYTDTTVLDGTDYYYIVRAEDSSVAGAGPCGGGLEDGNTVERTAKPTGVGDQVFFDDVELGSANWTLTAGVADTTGNPWAQMTDFSHSPSTAWFASDEAIVKDQNLEMAASLTVPAGSVELSFWHRFDLEAGFDGGVLEYSVDAGGTWNDILAEDLVNGVPANATRITSAGYNDTISLTFGSPISGRDAWSGTSAGFINTVVDLADFAGFDVRFRWRIGCDSLAANTGWWVDDVEIVTRSSCVAGPTTCAFTNLLQQAFFEGGDFSEWDFVRNPQGDLSVTGVPANLEGTLGMSVHIDHSNVRKQRQHYVTATHDAVDNYCWSFLFDPNSIAIPTGKLVRIWGAQADNGKRLLETAVRNSGGTFMVATQVTKDGGVREAVGFVPIPDAPVLIGGEWSNTAAGGVLRLFIDGVEVDAETGIPNVTRLLARPGMGNLGQFRKGTLGDLYFDAFEAGWTP